MDGTIGDDEEGVPQEPTVASMLGIRGPLRFRTHGSTQKAHVVLRQIELSEESGDEGDNRSMVYFSLFAQKRIEVKPGKEILLAVASPDGRFIDTPVILSGSTVEQKIDYKPEVSLKAPPDSVPAKPAVYTMPPRMRKAWPGQGSVGQAGSGSLNFPPSKSVSYASVGVQCEIHTTSRAVETEPEPMKAMVSSGIQAAEPPKFTHGKDTQTDSIVWSHKEGAAQSIVEVTPVPTRPLAAFVELQRGEAEERPFDHERERSLSPMDLDTAPSTPTLSPAVVPSKPSTKSDKRSKSLSYSPRTFSPPELSLSTTDTSQTLAVTEARLSPLRLSPDSGDAPGLSITPEVIAFQKAFVPPPVDRTRLRLPPPKEWHALWRPQTELQVNATTTPAAQPLSPPKEWHALWRPQTELQVNATATPAAQPLASVDPPTNTSVTPSDFPPSPSPMMTPETNNADLRGPETEHTPYVPKRKAVPNPFVSGGYLNDFVGTSTQTTVEPKPVPRSSSPKSTIPHPFKSPLIDRTTSLPDPPATTTPPNSPPATALLRVFPLPSQTHTKAASSLSNLTASTSKVKVEDIPQNGDIREASHLSPKADTSVYNSSPAAPKARAAAPPQSHIQPHTPHAFPAFYPEYPPRVASGVIPAVPARAPHPSLTATFPSGLNPWQPWLNTGTSPSESPRSIPPTVSVVPQPASVPQSIKPPTPPTTRRSTADANARNVPLLPAGPYSNPLQIKPALPVPPPTPVAPSAATSGSKKPIQVGNGWPYNTRSHARATASGNGAAKVQPSKSSVNSASPPAPSTSQSAGPSTPAPEQNEPNEKSEPQDPLTDSDNLVSRTSISLPEKSQPPSLRVSLSGVTSYQNIYGSGSGSNSNSTPSTRQTPTPTSASAATPSHPLPPKPPAFTGTAAGSYSPRRGVKRMVSPAPPAPEPKEKSAFPWATGDPVHSVKIKTEGEAGIRCISFNSDGTQFAVSCYDRSVRIWIRRTRTEIARLGHNMLISAVAWLEHDSGIATLGDNGVLSTWTRNAQNKWQWAKILDLRPLKESPSCLAFVRDRIAIALPSEGVKVWMFMKGTWIPQRSIGRQKVTKIKFVDEGEALVGGTEDGTLWHCEVPNGTLKALKISMKSPIVSLDTDTRGSLGLAALADGRCELVNIRLDANKGNVEQTYSVKDMELPGTFVHDFGAALINNGQRIIFGSVQGCVMVWDRSSGEVVYGLKHGEDDVVHTLSCFNGTANLAGLILTGTRSGQLTWFSPPPTDAGPIQTRKRVKV